MCCNDNPIGRKTIQKNEVVEENAIYTRIDEEIIYELCYFKNIENIFNKLVITVKTK